ncbi:tetraspanin-8-like isoform X2 [Phyllopteryx taeniolatus]|uniref:tetraspanin-8-like isoform X2 n=1 Tax=Phyllopteryx taeniolatus TaxID=161469 RepID=UPI002AD42714|nr:tetraspanin-8-like isoform X2 [Phyllopteryx taeniolatus]
MGKVNICLKRSLIIVTSLMILAGALMLAGTLFSHGHYHRDDEIEDMIVGIKVLYALSITTLVLPIIGLYGACKEKRWVLIVIIKIMSRFYLSMQPISNASELDLRVLEETQIELGCCGVQQGYKEWGYNISKSCLCNDTSDDCVAAPSNSSLFQLTDNKPVMIYKEPCLPLLLSHLNLAIDILVGTSAGLTSLWALSCVLSIAVLCQLKEKKDTLVVAYSREAKTGNYAVLAEPAELT